MRFDPQKIRPPHFSIAYLVLAIILQIVFQPPSCISTLWHWFGLIVLGSGVWIMTQAHGRFAHKGTPVSHAETPQGVVTDGLYRFSRNPMYVAGALFFLGIALLVGTWPFFLSWLLTGATLNFFTIPWEEKRMEELFGAEYLNYKAKTRRWL